MPCMPAVFSLPVEEARARSVEVRTGEGGGTRVSSSSSTNYSSSTSSTVAENIIIGTTLVQVHLEWEERFLGWVAYLPTHCQRLCRR